MRVKKRTKFSRQRGNTSHGWGARQRHRGKGCRGGVGMSGTGKRASQKQQLGQIIARKYGAEKYFGKKGFTSRRTQKNKEDCINLDDIRKNHFAEKIELKSYKILGLGEGFKATIIAKSASKSAIEKMEKAGGKIVLPEIKEKIENKIEKKVEGKTIEKKKEEKKVEKKK